MVKGYRLASLEYPDGRTIAYDYGTPGSTDDEINRLAAIEDGGQTLASYQYLGLNTIVVTDYPEPQLTLDYTGGNDSYSGLTQFNQVQEQIWSEYGATPQTLDQFTYSYDQEGNIGTRSNVLHPAFDETYGYNGLNELTSDSQGNQTWNLDGMGNLGSADAANENTAAGFAYDKDGNAYIGRFLNRSLPKTVPDVFNRRIAAQEIRLDRVFA